MKYLAVLGRQPELGLVELESRLGGSDIEPFGHVALLSTLPDINSLGGSLKLAKIITTGQFTSLENIKIEPSILPIQAGKTNFAISIFGTKTTHGQLSAFGLSLKKQLGGSLRLVLPTKPATDVSTAQLKFNKIPEKGFELILAVHKGKFVVALTTQIQDIDWYSKRDFDRPSRSAKVGMLPPKLAQILINTASSPVVFDPFCGTGVILQEAMLMGRTCYGSDLEERMVASTQSNLEWLAQVAPTSLPKWNLQTADARTVKVPKNNPAIVTEGYLGLPLGTSPLPDRLKSLQTELKQLYREFLTNMSKQLASGSELAVCLPVWRLKSGTATIELIDDLEKLGYTLKRFKHTNPLALTYRRPDQIVGRQILLLTRK